MSKVQGVLSKVQDPADRAALAARFGVTLASTGEPPRRGAAPHGAKGGGPINNQDDLLREVEATREALGLPPRDKPADGDDVPAGGIIDSEASLEREVKATRRALGLS